MINMANLLSFVIFVIIMQTGYRMQTFRSQLAILQLSSRSGMFQVSSQEKPHMGKFHVMSTLFVAHHEGKTEFWIWFWYVGTHLRKQISNRTVLV